MPQEINYDLLPEHMRGGARRYIEKGVMDGRFLQAVFENDFVVAYGHADSINTVYMPLWASFLYNEAPTPCWGSKEKVNDWIKKGGLYGLANNAGHSGKG